jgi:phage terminase small subunit
MAATEDTKAQQNSDGATAATNQPAADPAADAALSEQQKLYCAEFIVDFNGTAAAKRAGYTEGHAKDTACRLMKRPDIRAEIGRLLTERRERTLLTAENVMRELASIAFSDPADMLDADGNMLPLHLMPPHMRRAISGFDVDTVTRRESGEVVPIHDVYKIKFWDKGTALERAMRHLGLFEKDNKQRPALSPEMEAILLAARNSRARPDDGG